jgi:SAM-dependent methyltransferase
MSIGEIISIAVAVLSLVPVFFTFIDEKIFGTKVFKERKNAVRRMIKDMVRSTELNYVGITHDQITDFFEDAFSEDRALYWETINIFFPTSEYGACWDKDFNNKMSLNILKISNFLMNEHAGRLKALKQVNFYWNTCGFNIGGSLFRYRNSRHPYNVIYDVMQIVGTDKEQDNAKTIRLNQRFHKQFFQRLEDIFGEIKQGSTLLYSIDVEKKDLWNQSASSWEKYMERNPSPHSKSMRYMLNEINLAKDMNILSLGSGTGKLELQLIENRGYEGFLGVVDKSYTMLYKAYERMKNEKNVSYALLDLGRKDWTLYGELAARKYDYILMHFSLHNFINREQSLGDFAGRLRELLAYNGKIIVAIHDHVYGPFDENETLRSRIKEFGVENDVCRRERDNIIPLEELRSEFFNNGLKVLEETIHTINRDYEERVTMWKVDAILGSVIDIEALERNEMRQKLFNEMDKIGAGGSKPMTVKYITFSETIDVVSALIMNEAGEFLTGVKMGAYLLPGGEKDRKSVV